MLFSFFFIDIILQKLNFCSAEQKYTILHNKPSDSYYVENFLVFGYMVVKIQFSKLLNLRGCQIAWIFDFVN